MAQFHSLRAQGAHSRRNSKRHHALAASSAAVCEALEVRRLLTTFTVTNTGDNSGVNPAVGAGTGTLRQALVDSNADTAATNAIDFNIPGSGLQSINLAAVLPVITQPVFIDGSSQPGTTILPMIAIGGSNTGGSGFVVMANNSTITNLSILGFRHDAIDIVGASGVTISQDAIGIAPGSVLTAVGPNGEGIVIEGGAQNNTIGVSGSKLANVISDNTGAGIDIIGTTTGAQTSGNVIGGNFIGTTDDASGAIPNFNGVVIEGGAQNNTIGGTTSAAMNVISGNKSTNVVITGTKTGPQTSGNVVEGNDIGTDSTGNSTFSTGAASQGVSISNGAQNNTIGGDPFLNEGNVISGNAGDGVDIVGTKTGPQTSGNTVAGNHIGIGATNDAAVPNGTNGVVIEGGAQNNTIGNDDPAISNIISGNTQDGVEIIGTATGPQTTGNIVEDNRIGTNDAGTAAVANGSNGVEVFGGAASNTIGGNDGNSSNVISGNSGDGIKIEGTASGPITTGNTIEGNFIGIDANLVNALPNGGDGIALTAGVQSTTIGGTTALAENLISGNTGDGVHISGAATGTQTTGNVVEGNFIGTDSTGSTALANGVNGVLLDLGAENNTIGGNSAGVRNVISGNSATGVAISGTNTGPQSTDNTIAGNLIGTDVTGENAIPNGTGVAILAGAENNTIGGTTGGAANLISGNTGDGIVVNGQPSGPQTTGNTIEGNFIGTDGGATSAVSNGLNGIFINQGAANMTVGPNNVISGNTDNGIEISGTASGPQTTGITVISNLIGTDLNGKNFIGNTQDGVLIDLGAQNNTIGATVLGTPTVGTRNVISGNVNGVEIQGTASGPQTTGNVVEGDLIGTDVTGEAGLGNSDHGVLIDNGAQTNTVGGSVNGDRNVISANGLSGVSIEGAASGAQTSSNTVAGNFIGIDAKGTTALHNGGGVLIFNGASNNTIGGLNVPSINVISGNSGDGIDIDNPATGPQTSGNIIQSSYIGTDFTGTLAVPNAGDGVFISDGASANTIGGTASIQRDVISGNGRFGVDISGTTSGPQTMSNVVEGDFIGTDLNGANPIPNEAGIRLETGAQGNTIGGTASGSRNVISGNTQDGIHIQGTSSGPQTSSNTVAGNFIGTNSGGSAPIANGDDGVFIDKGAQSNTIGGTTAAARNLLSGNDQLGVQISGTTSGPQTTGNVVEGNFIGTDLNDATPVPNQAGVSLDSGAQNNTIGGSAAGAANVISGNQGVGIQISGTSQGSQTSGNFIEGNFIGTDTTGTKNLGNGNGLINSNQGDGIFLAVGASNNTIGGTIAGEGNVIAFNNGPGVAIGFANSDSTTINNLVRLNSIYSNVGLGIDLGFNGPTANHNGTTAGPDDDQNYPVLASAIIKTANTVTVQGTINSTASTPLIIDFYSTPTLGPGRLAQGETYLGSVGVTTDSSGNASFTTKLATAVPVGQFITATASTTQQSPVGDTSEFSAPIQVTQAAPVDTIAPTATLSSAPTITTATTAPYGFSITYNDNVAVNASTIPHATVTVTGPNGFSEIATLTSTNLTNGPSVTASYTIPAPAGGFTNAGNGTYTVSVSANSVADTSNNFLAGSAVGTFSVAIPAPDTTAPTATLSTAPTIATATTSPYAFTITYNDNVAVSAATIPAATVTVTGPNGFSETATLTSTGLTNGPSVAANYTIPAPAGGFSNAANGTYTVSVSSNSVQDTSNNFLVGGAVGTFSVNIAATVPTTTGSLSGSAATAAPSYNLTALGTGDWGAFGVEGNLSAFDHKATGGSQISSLTPVGNGNFGAFKDDTGNRSVNWSDGSPTAVDNNDTGFAFVNNGLNAGYTFTAPADTTSRTLFIYLGGFSSGATLTAHLSDGSAADFTESFSGAGKYNQLVTITYAAGSANQKLVLTYLKTSNINGTAGSADIMAAFLGGAPVAPVATAPLILTNPTSTTVAVGHTVTFTASASGNPTPTVQWQISTNGGTTFTNIAGATSTTFSFTANTGENGDQYRAVFTNSVNTATTSAATLTVTAAPTGGSLSGSTTVAASNYNLTQLGTIDWAKFGHNGSATGFDHKLTGGSQISNVTRVGSGNFGGFNDDTGNRTETWTDGTPDTKAINDPGFLFANNALGAGYSFTAPADTTARTIFIFLGGFSSGSTLTAHLSDGSAPDFTVSFSNAGKYNELATITYRAASASQQLLLTYVKSQNINGTGGSADLMAAWM